MRPQHIILVFDMWGLRCFEESTLVRGRLFTARASGIDPLAEAPDAAPPPSPASHGSGAAAAASAAALRRRRH